MLWLQLLTGSRPLACQGDYRTAVLTRKGHDLAVTEGTRTNRSACSHPRRDYPACGGIGGATLEVLGDQLVASAQARHLSKHP